MSGKLNRLLVLTLFILMASKFAIADQDFKVTGIMMGGDPVAIINGHMVKKGDQIEGAEVKQIDSNSVTLKYQGGIIVSRIVGPSPSTPQTTAFHGPIVNPENPPSTDAEDSNTSEQSSAAQEDAYPAISSSEVRDIHVFLSEEAGSISGYVIFYDSSGKECKVKTTEGSDREAVLYTGTTFFAKNKTEFDITPSGFEKMSLRGGGEVLAFPIPAFHVEGDWRELGFTFEWNNFKKKVLVTNY